MASACARCACGSAAQQPTAHAKHTRQHMAVCTCLPRPKPPPPNACACLGQITKEEYARHGADSIGHLLVSQLTAAGHRPYYIPVGGSSALGCWGYLQAVEEMKQQVEQAGLTFDVIAAVRWAGSETVSGALSMLLLLHLSLGVKTHRLPCPPRVPLAMQRTQAAGSGGTTAGLALGASLSGLCSCVRAYGVCDDEEYFYNTVDELYRQLGSSAGAQRADLGCALVVRMPLHPACLAAVCACLFGSHVQQPLSPHLPSAPDCSPPLPCLLACVPAPRQRRATRLWLCRPRAPATRSHRRTSSQQWR